MNTYNKNFIGRMKSSDNGQWVKTSEANQELWNSKVLYNNMTHKHDILKELLETERNLTATLIAGLISMSILWILTVAIYILQ